MFPMRETLFAASVFVDANYAYATGQVILTKIRACEHLQQFCDHEQANTHLIFVSNSSKGQFCERFHIGWDHSIPLSLFILLVSARSMFGVACEFVCTVKAAKYEVQNPQLVAQHCFVASFGSTFRVFHHV